MAYIGQAPANKAVSASDLEDGIITNAKLAQDIISAETELAEAPASTDEFLISDGGTLKRLDASFIGGDNTPYFYVRKTSDQTGINHNTAVKATFDTEDLDTDSAYASNKFTVPSGEGGKYFLFASAPLLANNVSKLRRAELMLYKNGSLLKRTYSDYQANDIQGSYENVSGIFDLSASDYIETYVRIRTSDSSNSNYIQGSTSTTTVMGGYKLIG